MDEREFIKQATSRIYSLKKKQLVASELHDHIESRAEWYRDAGYDEAAVQKNAPWFHSTGRMVIYGFICCIFSCGCKRLCRSGLRQQPAVPQSKERYCCCLRSADW